MKLNKIISSLFRVARLLIDFKAVASGDLVKVGRRIKNKYLGRKIIKKLW